MSVKRHQHPGRMKELVGGWESRKTAQRRYHLYHHLREKANIKR